MSDKITYLNRNSTSPMYSKLKRAIEEGKQGRADPAQWGAMIKAMTTKGVKSMEIDEVNILNWLDKESAKGTAFITKKELAEKLDSLSTTVKEVQLQSPKFSGARQQGGNYKEYLYIANSERDNIVDDLERVEYEMDALAFTPELIYDNPEIVINLERERENLIRLKSKAIEFTAHHFSGDTTNRHGKNLLAHCRITERPTHGVYMIEEIQSDWAQRGRRSDWSNIPKGPWVTSTEAWAGLVLRRQLQLAAMNPGIKNIGWITESMRNGGRQNLSHEATKVEQKKHYDSELKRLMDAEMARIMGPHNGATDAQLSKEQKAAISASAHAAATAELGRLRISEPYDMLNDFYLKVIPKIADKILSGTGGKVELKQLEINAGNVVTIPTIALTDAVREKLADKQPVYSRALLLKEPAAHDDQKLNALVASASHMIGSPKHLRLVTHLFDVATGAKVAGRYVNNMVQVSLLAKNIEEAMDHECFHFAQENLLSTKERDIVERAFAYGSPLNDKVREILTKRQDFALAKQCLDPQEASAQGFALWRAGLLDVREAQPQGVFADVVNCIKSVSTWMRKVVLLEDIRSTEDVFVAFAKGDIARRQTELEAARRADPDNENLDVDHLGDARPLSTRQIMRA
jgi:hypothetical protein